MFSLLLSFMMDSYNFIPLTPKAKMHGIKKIFCSNILDAISKLPFPVPNIVITVEIVYPKQKPRKAITRYKIGIPITVHPRNHSKIPIPILFFKESKSKPILSMLPPSFKEVIKVVM